MFIGNKLGQHMEKRNILCDGRDLSYKISNYVGFIQFCPVLY